MKVVRVQSARRKKSKSRKRPKKSKLRAGATRSGRFDIPPLPAMKSRSTPYISKTHKGSAKLEIGREERMAKILEKIYVKGYFEKWTKLLGKTRPKEETKTPTKSCSDPFQMQKSVRSRHKKKVSEFIQKPFSLLLLSNQANPVKK